MNSSTMIFLLTDKVQGVRIKYDPANKSEASYLFKTMDKNLEVDDYVIIPTNSRCGMTVGQVVEVNADVDLDTSLDLKWVMGRVNIEAFEEIKEQELAAMDTVRKAEKRKRRDELRKNLIDNAGEEITKLAICDNSTS